MSLMRNTANRKYAGKTKFVEINSIKLSVSQIISQQPLVVNLTEKQQAILEKLDNTVIKIDISEFYSEIGLDAPYAWISRNSIKLIGDTTNGAMTYEFVCSSNDIDASANMTKLGSIGIYYFYQTAGLYSAYDKKIIITFAKVTLSNISHATNINNDTTGSLLQAMISDEFVIDNPQSGRGSQVQKTRAVGVSSAVFGGIGRADGDSSFVANKSNIAPGWAASAFGNNTFASGAKSFTEGSKTTASGDSAHAGGLGTVAASNNQFVIGKYNIIDTEGLYAFIIGNGTDNEHRSNALAVKWDGTIVTQF